MLSGLIVYSLRGQGSVVSDRNRLAERSTLRMSHHHYPHLYPCGESCLLHPPILRVRCQGFYLFIPIYCSLPFVLHSSSTRFIQPLRLIKKIPVCEGIRAGTTFWNEIPSCSSVTLKQLRGETDLSVITDPLVTIIKCLISYALRHSQSAALLTAACHSLCSS